MISGGIGKGKKMDAWDYIFRRKRVNIGIEFADMLQPHELKLRLPMMLSNGVRSTTEMVWSILKASYEGELEKVKKLVSECPELIYAQYNYTPLSILRLERDIHNW